MKYDLLHIQGKPYVLVPLHDYRDMTDGGSDDLPNDVLDEIAANPLQKFRIIRKYRDLTQVDLAKRAGISRPYLTEIETGKKEGSIRAIKALAEALDIDIGLLIG